jgi:decaprenylphospho-beta-D-ribofuranose 2-oxidase
MRTTLYGWGRTNPSAGDLLTPENEQIVTDLLGKGERIATRGLGRSYGDPAQLSGGVVLSNRAFNEIGNIDDNGLVRVGAGVSFDELLQVSIPRGWFVPVTPGTRQVTMGGAFAADVHGKNHHVDGSFCSHVESLRLLTPLGAHDITPCSDPELFWASAGAMGLTGFITSLDLRLLPITTNQVLVDTERFSSLDAVMEAMKEHDADYRYSVAWVDCMTRGAHMGRAILTRGVHREHSDIASPSLEAPKTAKLVVPFNAPSGLLNPLSVRVFNELWFRSAPKHERGEAQSLSTFFHPLDGVRDWNRLYGRRGFVQYQFCVPDDAGDTIVRAIERLSSSGVASFLAVLKRFGPSNAGLLSFPMAGWTLALDLPVGSSALPRVLDGLDDMVLEAGGRIYFAKDARLSPTKVRAMYPKLDEFLAIKHRVDPDQQLSSDLARRLRLVGK